MQLRTRLGALGIAATAAVLLAAGPPLATGPALASSHAAPAGRSGLTVSGGLGAVSAYSPSSAWAVGGSGSGTLLAHWNGTRWRVVRTPGPSGAAFSDVATTSRGVAWLVGEPGAGVGKPLIMEWNGRTWKQMRKGVPESGLLSAVAASSSRNAWAVGWNSLIDRTLPLAAHWNGSSWRQVASPDFNSATFMLDVATTRRPSSNAWAIISGSGSVSGYDTEHRTGKAWTVVTSPTLPHGANLESITVTSARNAWAVGDTYYGDQPFILHWNGTAWTLTSAPSIPGGEVNLRGVTATSATDAWAVGWAGPFAGPNTSLILHWNGRKWQ